MTAPVHTADSLDLANSSTRGTNHFARLATGFAVLSIVFAASGCTNLKLPTAAGLDLMSPGFGPKNATSYEMLDGTVPADDLATDGSMTMEAYEKIREAKAQNAVVLQVAGDEQPVRVLPLPEGEKSVFVSELLDQTGVIRRYGTVYATLYRQSPQSIAGIKMKIKITDDGKIDPSTDYGLRAGDRVQVRQKKNTPLQMLVDVALRR